MNRLDEIKENVEALRRDMPEEYTGNVDIAIAFYAVLDELMILENKIGRLNASLHRDSGSGIL